MELRKLLTPAQTAEILGIAEDTLTVWRCTRRVVLPYVKIGRHVRYDPATIAKFIEERTATGTADAAGR